MLAGSTCDRDRERAGVLGAAGYLTKPPSPFRLMPVLNRLRGVRVEERDRGGRLLRAC